MKTSWNKGIPESAETKLKKAATFAAKRAILPKEKACNKCGEIKELELFPKKKDNADGKHGSCKVCEGERKKKYKPTAEQSRVSWLRREFGITVEDYNTLFENQNGCCAICNSTPASDRSLAVDHCHTTGKIRGLLCFRCNGTLGKFNDDVSLFQKAIDYLSIKKPTQSGLFIKKAKIKQ